MGGLCTGGAGQGGAHGLAPPPAPLPTLLPGASCPESLPAMTGAPALALLLLGQLLTATSAQVSAGPRVLTGSGLGPDVKPCSLGQPEPPGPTPESRRRGPSRTSVATSPPPCWRVLVMQLSLINHDPGSHLSSSNRVKPSAATMLRTHNVAFVPGDFLRGPAQERINCLHARLQHRRLGGFLRQGRQGGGSRATAPELFGLGKMGQEG